MKRPVMTRVLFTVIAMVSSASAEDPAARIESMEKIADLALVAPKVNTSPLPEYGYDRLVPLLDDARFERGFTVWSPKPGRHVKEGALRPSDSMADPAWGLAQWHSRFTLAGAEPESLPGGAKRYTDAAKAVTFFPKNAEADISFALSGDIEYEGCAPQPGDPWPHLLAERDLLVQPPITDLESVPFSVRYRLIQADVHRPDGFDPSRHTAQFVFYITVQNRNRQSAGFGDYYWFGVPMYDTRYRLPRAHKAVDKGSDRKPATGKFIFNPGGERYTTHSAHDGDWVAVEKDLLPLIREGLETAWRAGYVQDSRDMADYRLIAMNTGWEVTGPLDVEMQIAGLQLEAVLKADVH
jgi:hypothetical protein